MSDFSNQNFNTAADIATEASAVALEAALKSLPTERLGEDETLGVLLGLLRAAARWSSLMLDPAMDPGIHLMFAKALAQERAREPQRERVQ